MLCQLAGTQQLFIVFQTPLESTEMKESVKKRKLYEAPKLMNYGDIRKLTAAAVGCPGAMDSLYYMGYINNLNGCPDPDGGTHHGYSD